MKGKSKPLQIKNSISTNCLLMQTCLPLAHENIPCTTYTSARSFRFFNSFFSFSSKLEAMPFWTSSNFSLTWSSMFSTCGPKKTKQSKTSCQTDNRVSNMKKVPSAIIFPVKDVHTVLNILGPPSCPLSKRIHLLDMALLKPIFPKDNFYTHGKKKCSDSEISPHICGLFKGELKSTSFLCGNISILHS